MPDPDTRPTPPAAPPREDVDDLMYSFSTKRSCKANKRRAHRAGLAGQPALNKVLFLRIIHSFTLHLAVSCI